MRPVRVTEENVNEFEDTSGESVQNETQRGRKKAEGRGTSMSCWIIASTDVGFYAICELSNIT